MKRLTFKKLLLAVIGLTAVAAAAAEAADLPRMRGLPPPRAPSYVPFFSWTGLYVGINAGYAFGDSRWTDTVTTVTTGDFDVNGAMVGGTLGYNLQFGSAVFGIEGDFDWSGVKGSSTTNCPLGCETRNTWFGTARGRIGYAFDRFLPYFTGGAAFGDIKQEAVGFGSSTSSQFGWVLGGGIEYAFLSSWSAKLEYLYADMGTAQCPATTCGTPADATLKLNIVRAGLNYKF